MNKNELASQFEKAVKLKGSEKGSSDVLKEFARALGWDVNKLYVLSKTLVTEERIRHLQE
ncbi:hypothetical protein [Maridesulfovibrio ferrireducens]|uniref:hypothetical protein n=1 Tax=Maridesulfovibrio ferrireducens TaxID=246191 RepID=UPI001A358AD6|nr:hypothetical protein [Maridesulfovibrio ferrireducens]MBI9110085.1 hypothetical protein [Maridesulfovibrio ferrireducens]